MTLRQTVGERKMELSLYVKLCRVGIAPKLWLVATCSLPPAGCSARGRNISMSPFIKNVPTAGSPAPVRDATCYKNTGDEEKECGLVKQPFGCGWQSQSNRSAGIFLIKTFVSKLRTMSHILHEVIPFSLCPLKP